MLKIEFHGAPFLFISDSLDESGAITTAEKFTAGQASFAHYWLLAGGNGIVKRFNELIGSRADIQVIGPAEVIEMTIIEALEGLGNMLGGDPKWRRL